MMYFLFGTDTAGARAGFARCDSRLGLGITIAEKLGSAAYSVFSQFFMDLMIYAQLVVANGKQQLVFA